MASVCLYFHLHQPYRIRDYRVFDIGKSDYFSAPAGHRLSNKDVLNKVADKCYVPATTLIKRMLHDYPEFKVSYSITGIVLDQLQEYRPDVIKLLQEIVATGRVELVSETYYHSLAALYSPTEFENQVKDHKKLLKKLFSYTPKVFRNTELIYNNALAQTVADLGYKVILTEGADHVLGWRSPNYIYSPPQLPDVKLLLKNYRLSDDIAFRFSDRNWADYPLTAPKFGQWVSSINGSGELVNLFMDYETLGEHQWEDSGIFDFLYHFPAEVLRHPDNNFVTPSEAAKRYPSRAELDIPNYISWADVERDLSAWRSNDMQHDALNRVYALEKRVYASKNPKLVSDWRKLQTSDHFYYMCTKWFNDGDVHKYFNPYSSPYEAFIAYMNVLKDFELRLNTPQTVKAPAKTRTAVSA